MLAICGLGNVGKAYEYTRHNAGFLAIDRITLDIGVSFKKLDKLSASVASYAVNNTDILFVKPLTFMNDSGICVQKIMQYYKLSLHDVIVIHDDLDIALGMIKTKQGGGSGGHNGIRSIDCSVGNNYKRIRIGIGKPENNQDVVEYVLGRFFAEEQQKIDMALETIVQNLTAILQLDLSALNASHN